MLFGQVPKCSFWTKYEERYTDLLWLWNIDPFNVKCLLGSVLRANQFSNVFKMISVSRVVFNLDFQNLIEIPGTREFPGIGQNDFPIPGE